MNKIYQTSEGINLYEDENRFYSEDPAKVIKSLQKKVRLRTIEGMIAAEILEECYARGIQRINKKLWLFTSDAPEESDVVVMIFAKEERAALIAIKKFVDWGYLGKPIAII